MRGISETVKHLIIINVLMFVGTLAIGNGELFYKWFALYFPKNELFQPWQVITHMFMHGGLMHLLFNYYFNFLPAYSDLVNSGLSDSEIIQMFKLNKAIEGISQAQFSQLQQLYPIYNASMVGASGCIMGILAAFGMMNPNAKLMMIFLPIPIKAKYFIPGIIILDLISAISGQSFFSPSNTAYMAHVGGALTGFIIMWIWKKNQFDKYRWDK